MARLLLFHPSRSCWSVALRNFSSCSVFHVHTTSRASAGQKWRISHGLSRSGTEYGPLTDLPDWSYADGTPAPVPDNKKKRLDNQNILSNRIKTLMKQVDSVVLKEVRKEYGLDHEEPSASKLNPKTAHNTKQILDNTVKK